ncbi:MAG: hypothetical protein R2759_15905 [Bacteroidales bacterium]
MMIKFMVIPDVLMRKPRFMAGNSSLIFIYRYTRGIILKIRMNIKMTGMKQMVTPFGLILPQPPLLEVLPGYLIMKSFQPNPRLFKPNYKRKVPVSLLAGGFFNLLGVYGDSAIIPNELHQTFKDDLLFNSVSVGGIGISVGYSHTFVIWKISI